LKIQPSLLSKPDEQNDDEKQDSNSDAEKTEVEDNSSLKEENKTGSSVVISKHGEGKTDKISVVRRGRKRLNLNRQSKVILEHDSSLKEGIISNENPQLKEEVLVDVVSHQQDGRSKKEENIRLDQSLKKESKTFQTKSSNFEKQKSDQEQQKPPQRANLSQQPLLQSTVQQKVASGPKISTTASTSRTTPTPFPTTTSESAPTARLKQQRQQEKAQSEPKTSMPTKSPNKNLESSDNKK
jgi:hypothetical protein